MGKIRVLRVLEYVYEDVERMAEDMGRWTVQVNANGMSMRSAVLPLTLTSEDDEPSTLATVGGYTVTPDGVLAFEGPEPTDPDDTNRCL